MPLRQHRNVEDVNAGHPEYKGSYTAQQETARQPWGARHQLSSQQNVLRGLDAQYHVKPSDRKKKLKGKT